MPDATLELCSSAVEWRPRVLGRDGLPVWEHQPANLAGGHPGSPASPTGKFAAGLALWGRLRWRFGIVDSGGGAFQTRRVFENGSAFHKKGLPIVGTNPLPSVLLAGNK